jgi:hypothetical protein
MRNLVFLLCTHHFQADQIKTDYMGGHRGETRSSCKILVGKSEGKDYLGEILADGE